MTQCERIVDYIKKHGSITQGEAYGALGITRLASRINDLKMQGYSISDRWIVVNNRFEEPCRVKQYFLKENESVYNSQK